MLKVFTSCILAFVLAFSCTAETGLLPISTGPAANSVFFYLYNQISQYGTYQAGRQLFTNGISTLDDSGINAAKPFIVLVHGTYQTYKCGYPQDIKDAYLNLGEDVSVVTVNWGDIACANVTTQVGQLACYPTAVARVGAVGQAISDFLTQLVQNGLTTPGNIRLVGVSSGVYVAGEAGNRFLNANGVRVQRITGLDPGGPALTCGGMRCLSTNDADFVDVIHTDMGVFGTTYALGDIDFYPNGGGHPQPTCEGQDDTCSHATSTQYWLQSIGTSNIIATQCGSYQDFTNGLCSNGATSVFGDSATPGPTGNYYLSITPQPFSGRYTCFD